MKNQNKMKNFRLILLLLLLSAVGRGMAQASFGQPVNFDNGWRFILADDQSFKNTTVDDSKWRKLDLPHDWSVEGRLSPSLASCTGYLPGGIGWYRKHFTVNDGFSHHYIYFEGVYNRSEVYLNGKLLGKRPNGFISFMYDITPYLQSGDNVIAVRVDHSKYADSRWYTGSGIYRDVYLIGAGDTHFAQWGIGWKAEKISDSEATIHVDMAIESAAAAKGKMEVKSTLLDASGKEVATASQSVHQLAGKLSASVNLKVAHPKRWNLDSPYLYTLKNVLTVGGKQVDSYNTRVGIRTLTFNADNGFALNGKWMKVKGVCLHHDAGVLGAVVPADVWRRRLTNLKSIGVNAIRMSHNPQNPAVYDLCDELGLLVMDEASDEWEFPKRKWIEGWNVGTPGFEGSYDFFNEWIDRDVADMVKRDRNHASVFLWSIGNEVDYPNDPYSHPILDSVSIKQQNFGGYNPKAPSAMRIGEIAKRLSAIVRGIDTSRPTTGALAGVVMSNQTAYPTAVDVVGYNYTESRFDLDHGKYPKRIIYSSETTPDINAWYAVRDRKFIFGQFIWTGTDYLGESGRWPSRGLYTGLLDFGSFIKPRGYFRASLWCDKPITYIGTYPANDWVIAHNDLSIDAWDIWNYDDSEMIRVVCYTNSPQARLLLNGKEVGAMKAYDKKSGIISWDIPYSQGELTAQGCDKDGKVMAEYTIKSSGRPYALKVSVDKNEISKDRAVAHITINVVDENGTIVKLGDNDITCVVDGQAKLLGLEGSDNTDMGDYTDNVQRAYHGRLLAYIQSNGQAGTVKVKFTSPLLKGAEVSINIK
jgi:beta-galactosidase